MLTESVPAAYITEAQSMMSSSRTAASEDVSEVSHLRSLSEVETKDGAPVPSSWFSVRLLSDAYNELDMLSSS